MVILTKFENTLDFILKCSYYNSGIYFLHAFYENDLGGFPQLSA